MIPFVKMTKFKKKGFMFLSRDSCILLLLPILALFLTPTTSALFELDRQLKSIDRYNNNRRLRSLRLQDHNASFALSNEPNTRKLTIGGPCNKATGAYCAQGEYCVSSVCTICPAGSFCPGHNGKEFCIRGTISVSPGATSCSACPAGKYSVAPFTSCVDCFAGRYCPGAQGINDCPGGTYSTATGAKVPTVCTVCPAGKYTGDGSLGPCENCETGHFCTGATYEASCDPTTYLAAASATVVTQCTKCKLAGFYGDYAQRSECNRDCAAMYFCPKGAGSHYCPRGTKSLKNSDDYTDCTQNTCKVGKACYGVVSEISCPDGFIAPSSGPFTVLSQCVACPAGTYSSSGKCSAIGQGQYSPGGMPRVPCPQGRYLTGSGGTSWTSCSASPVCPPGQQLASSGSSCAACGQGIYCPGNGNMFSCPAGTYSASTSATSARDCLPCAAGTYSNNVKTVSCRACDVGSYCPEGAIMSTKCAGGTFSRTLSAGDAAVCSACTAGLTPHDIASGCISCRVNGYCTGGATTIQTCQDGFFSAALGATTPSSCVACAAGTYIDNTNFIQTACQVCEVGGYCPAASKRIACPAGTANKNAFSTSAVGCVACAAGFHSDGDTNTCLYCRFGSYCPGGSAAIKCPMGTYAMATEGTSATICSICPTGKFSGHDLDNRGAKACVSCMFGFYCPGGSAEALPFPSGTMSENAELTDASSRTICAAGTYSTSGKLDGLFCATCLPGYYCPGRTDKIACPVGTYNPETGSLTILACLACDVGTYSVAGVGDKDTVGGTSCKSWSPGSYCPSAGKPKVLCPEGTFNPDSGATTVAACISCPSGKFSATGSVICTTCQPGSYCPGATNQIACNAGYYSTRSGATSMNTCKACAAGTYSDNGAVACSTCTAGQYCPGASAAISCGKGFYSTAVGATTNAGCKSCAAGYYSELNSLGCTQCFGGTYCPGASYYRMCPAGKYNSGSGSSSATACVSCAASTYSAEGAVFCATCPPGFYCPAASDKVLCPAGKVSTGHSKTAAASCTSCAAGTFANPEGTFCLPCRPGSYCPSGGVAIECAAGKYGVTSEATTSSACVMCEAGSYEDSTGSIMCKLCSIGTNTAITGSTSCICKAGYYCPDLYTEIICPAGSTSAAGASECIAPPTTAPTAAPSISFVPTPVPTYPQTAVPSAVPNIAPSEVPSVMSSIVPCAIDRTK